jgi:hypothetical protein
MEPKRVIRKLAAIIIADVVGFSRHMERDDAGTLARLREIREQSNGYSVNPDLIPSPKSTSIPAFVRRGFRNDS